MDTNFNNSNKSADGSTDRLRQMAAVIPNLDTQRVAELNATSKLLSIDTKALAAEQKRLTAKYGESHPRVLALAARISARQPLNSALQQEITRASIKPVAYDPTTTGMLAGRVFDPKLQPLANVTVYVADAEKKPLASLSSCTDGNGYYSIPFSAEQAGQFKQQSCHLNVRDSAEKNVFTDKADLAVTIGATYNKNIVIGDAGCPPLK